MNILIADDEVATRELVAEILGGEGHEITLAEDGEDALEKFKRSWHDIVFSDILMPKMNGIELLAAVKVKGKDKPVVMYELKTLPGQEESTIEERKPEEIPLLEMTEK